MKNKFFTRKRSLRCKYCACGPKFAGAGKGMVMSMQGIDEQTMEKVELLAKLSLQEDERERVRMEMEKLLKYMEELEELDSEDEDALIHILPHGNVFREDVVTNESGCNMLMKNAPKSKDCQLVVPRTIQASE